LHFSKFAGVVVENFSYVFQTTGGAKSITREEMRSFKKVWAEFANQKTGYLERSRFVPFFAVGSEAFLLDLGLTYFIETERNFRSPDISHGVYVAQNHDRQ
jgi:hypothetical protein